MKLQSIDSLRGIAILLVILVHTSKSVEGLSFPVSAISNYGQMGVQLFFLVSAYTLCLSMERRYEERFKEINFFIRRFFRIAPLYYVGIVVFLLRSIIKQYLNTGQFAPYAQYDFPNITANLFFVHGFYERANNNIVPGGWSIGTEMAFYLCFPLLFFLIKKLKVKTVPALFVLPFLALAINILFRFATGVAVENNKFEYFNLINQLPIFLLGISLFFGEKLDSLRHLNWKIDIAGFGFFTALSMLLWKMPFPYTFALIPFFSTLSFVFLYDLFAQRKGLNHPLLLKLGKVSFSVYMFHYLFAGDLSKAIYQSLNGFLAADMILLICFIATVVLSYSIALLTEPLIERRGIEWGKQLIHHIEANFSKS